MKNSPKKPGQDQGSKAPSRTDKRDPSQPAVKRDQPQGQHDKQANKSGQQPHREDERPLKEDRQPVGRSAQKQTTTPRAKGQSTDASKNAPSRDIENDDDDYSPEDEDMDEMDLTDEDADEE